MSSTSLLSVSYFPSRSRRRPRKHRQALKRALPPSIRPGLSPGSAAAACAPLGAARHLGWPAWGAGNACLLSRGSLGTAERCWGRLTATRALSPVGFLRGARPGSLAGATWAGTWRPAGWAAGVGGAGGGWRRVPGCWGSCQEGLCEILVCRLPQRPGSVARENRRFWEAGPRRRGRALPAPWPRAPQAQAPHPRSLTPAASLAPGMGRSAPPSCRDAIFFFFLENAFELLSSRNRLIDSQQLYSLAPSGRAGLGGRARTRADEPCCCRLLTAPRRPPGVAHGGGGSRAVGHPPRTSRAWGGRASLRDGTGGC